MPLLSIIAAGDLCVGDRFRFADAEYTVEGIAPLMPLLLDITVAGRESPVTVYPSTRVTLIATVAEAVNRG